MKRQSKVLKIIPIFIPILSLLIPISYAQKEGSKDRTIIQKELPEDHKQKISLEIKGMDVLDVLKIFSTMTNLNIVASRNVKGKVTLFLKDVDIMDAFKIFLSSNNLAYDEENGIINVITEKDYELLYGRKFRSRTDIKIVRLEYAKALNLTGILNQTKSKIGKIITDEDSNTLVLIDTPESLEKMQDVISRIDLPTETEIFSLNYAKASEIKDRVSERLTKGLGVVQIDERTNKLIVTELSSNIPLIKKIVSAFDQKDKQVLIDAKIIQVTLNDEYKFGVNWDAVFSGLNSALGSNFKVITGSIIPTTESTAPTGGALKIGELASNNYQVIIKALRKIGSTNILSSPTLTVLNNQEARIMVGTNQPYATSTTTVPSSGSPVTSYQITYLDLGLKLYVTPTINEDNFITMKIEQEVSSKTGEYEYGEFDDTIPVVETSNVETTVTIKDGSTVIIAGLIKNRDQEEIKKIPLLGDLPVVGWLFKSKEIGSDTDPEKTELVIFLTPHIISGDMDLPEEKDYSRSLGRVYEQ